MSIEKALADNTEAIKSLEVAIRAAAAGVTTTTGALPPKAAAEKEQTAKPAATAAAPAAPAAPAGGEVKTDAVTYDTVKAAVNALAKAKGRDSVIAVLGKFNVKKADEVPADKWPELLAALNTEAATPAALA